MISCNMKNHILRPKYHIKLNLKKGQLIGFKPTRKKVEIIS
jgi:hypothetical protein